MESSSSCGLGGCRPRCLQPLRSVKVFMMLLTLTFIGADGFSGYLVGCITTIERRFEFLSKQSGLLMTMNTLAFVVSIIFTSHVGRAHKPLAIAVGCVVSAVGILVTMAPHFVFGSGVDDTEATVPTATVAVAAKDGDGHSTCFGGNGTEDAGDCGDDGNANEIAYAMMCVGEAIRGVGSSIFFTLGFAYVDDNVGRSYAPFYL
ncbi:PREDICTED: solute carrier organic anion transporter family member 4A1-like, partial [Priapulus caudatus]|uniref:Solute carrier organic anion transporter family member 4A1-like n=1 Tax=Priapulus caudatus TaxID=37621 RepID=A0ABM1ETX7_PRICU